MSKRQGDWHRDFPPDTKVNLLDMIAKALMIRAGGSVVITVAELRLAADTQAEVCLCADGSLAFRVEQN